MKKIKVLFAINDCIVGGAQKLTTDILARLGRGQFEPVLVTFFQLSDRATLYHLLPADIPVRKLSFRNFFDIASWRAFLRVLRAECPDVIVSNLFFSDTVTRVLGFFLDIPVITVVHNTYTDQRFRERITDRILARFSFAVVAVSESVRTFIVECVHINPSKVRVIRNGIDTRTLIERVQKRTKTEWKRELGFKEGRSIILSVARLTEQKNHKLLLEGFALFARVHAEYDLVVLGEGALADTLQEQAARLGLTERVHFMGNRDDVYAFLGAADFVASTSLIEGLSIAFLEALSAGVPIVATKTAGTDELVEEGKNGFFIQAYTPEAVVDAFTRMQVAGDTLREQARSTAVGYDISETVRNYGDLVRDAAGSVKS